MTWGAPLLAGIVAAIAVPALIILYFLKLRRRTVEVSTTLLWKKAIQDLQANAPFQKLRKNILLLLQLLILAAAILALAQPRSAQQAEGGRRLVLFIDRSASMSSVDGADGRSRLDLAKQQALEQIDAMAGAELFSDSGGSDQATVIAFDESAEIVAQFTADKAALRAAVESVTPTDAPSNLADAFKLAMANRPKQLVTDAAPIDGEAEVFAAEGLVGGDPFEFHLYSDGRLDGLELVDPEEFDSFEYHTVGDEGAANIGITGIRAERGYEDPTQITIYVGVQSTDAQPRTVDVELGIGDSVARIKTLALPAAQTPAAAAEGTRPTPAQSGVVFELERADGFLSTVTLRTGDSLTGDVLRRDNTGWVVVPPARQTSVAVVTTGNFFVTQALSGLPLSRLDTLSPSEFAVMLEDGRADRYDVVLLDGWLPEPMAAGASMRGRWLIFNAVPPPPFGVLDEGSTGPTAVIDWARTHPVLRDVVLDGLRIIDSRLVSIPEDSTAVSLAQGTRGPAMIELGSADARAVLVPFDLAQTSWPFDVGFVVFLASAVDYLGAESASVVDPSAARRQFEPGQVLTTRLPPGVETARLLPPEGAAPVKLVAGPDGSVAYGPVRRAGVYTVRWAGEPGPADAADSGGAARVFAVNMSNPAESDVSASGQLSLADRQRSGTSGERGQRVREFWPWLLLAALAIMMLEWWVYNRKVHV